MKSGDLYDRIISTIKVNIKVVVTIEARWLNFASVYLNTTLFLLFEIFIQLRIPKKQK